jgi:hypothetical protein
MFSAFALELGPSLGAGTEARVATDPVRLCSDFCVARNQRAHLIGAAKGRGPLVFAHIGVLRAAEPDVEGVFDTSGAATTF